MAYIYRIINKISKKCYIGETKCKDVTRRWNQHKQTIEINKGCPALRDAVKKYGIDNFEFSVLIICFDDERFKHEIEYIKKYNSVVPNGYNLTNGGQSHGYLRGKKIILDDSEIMLCSEIKPPNPNLKRSEYTKNLISKRLIEFKSDISHRKEMMVVVQKQHEDKRFDQFKDVIFDDANIDKYIHVIRNNTLNYEYIRVSIGKIRTTFVGKFETIDDIKNRARMFILDLIKWQRDQIAGSSLEPSLPLTC